MMITTTRYRQAAIEADVAVPIVRITRDLSATSSAFEATPEGVALEASLDTVFAGGWS